LLRLLRFRPCTVQAEFHRRHPFVVRLSASYWVKLEARPAWPLFDDLEFPADIKSESCCGALRSRGKIAGGCKLGGMVDE
jgi:hypothetical protein